MSMTEPRVEAGDRALDATKKGLHLLWEAGYFSCSGEKLGHAMDLLSMPIQSAMNAQEREWQAFLVKARKRVKELETMEFRDFTHRAGELAVWRVVVEEAERLLAERGEGHGSGPDQIPPRSPLPLDP
jgi:hypothetical protein